MFILSCKKLGADIALLLLSVAVATANQQDGEQTPAAKIRGCWIRPSPWNCPRTT